MIQYWYIGVSSDALCYEISVTKVFGFSNNDANNTSNLFG